MLLLLWVPGENQGRGLELSILPPQHAYSHPVTSRVTLGKSLHWAEAHLPRELGGGGCRGSRLIPGASNQQLSLVQVSLSSLDGAQFQCRHHPCAWGPAQNNAQWNLPLSPKGPGSLL